MELKENAINKLTSKRLDKIVGNEQEELDYVDVYYPKIETILGLDNIIDMFKGKQPISIFKELGLEESDYYLINSHLNNVEELIFDLNKKGLNEELILSRLESNSNNLLLNIAMKRRNFLKNSNADLTKYDEKINDFFNNDNKKYQNIKEYEDKILENNNGYSMAA